MDKPVQDNRRNSEMQGSHGQAQLKTPDHRKPSARRTSTLSGHRRFSASARRYRPSLSRASRRSSGTLKWGKGVYLAIIIVGILVAVGGGFGIGVALYPNILSSTSIQDALGTNPMDVQSDNSADDEILISESTTTSTNQPRVGIDTANCGRSALVPPVAAQRLLSIVEKSELLDRRKRIVNGVLGSLIYFPWQISLWFGEGHACGGSIIASNWILTAAHCLQPNPDPKNWTVHAGVNLQWEMYSGISQEMEPSDLVIHPGFSTETFENDVALIRLTNHLELGKKVSPACLPTLDDEVIAGKRCFISGWGAKEEGGDVEPALLNATVEIIDGFVCNGEEWLAGLLANDFMICAGKESGEVDACQGDSGGPLSCQREDGRFVVSGVVSWGIGCGTYRMPGVYARVTQYRSWILESVQTIDLKYR